MRTDVVGRVKNTALTASKPLLPLYEAVVNSIQAIEEAGRQDGRIEIVVLRDKSQLFGDQDVSLGDINGFAVIDNGIGFNEANFRAFETSDTTYKAQKGGRGVGRFLWLVAFARVEVVSHFDHDGAMKCRRFAFLPEGDGVGDMSISNSSERNRTTAVRLTGFQPKYQQQCPKKLETIATRLIEHCLEYFIRSDCPLIIPRDGGAVKAR
jgi:hypothetical protein